MSFWNAGAAVVSAGIGAASAKSDRDAAEDLANRSRSDITAGTEQARQDINLLFPEAQQARLGGFQAAQDIFGSAVPQQAQQFQQGNLQAQQTTGLGAQQMQNALLGLPVDYGFMQPQQTAPLDFSFLNTPLRQPQTMEQAQQAQTTSAISGIANDADLFRAASQGMIPNISAADQQWFGQHLQNVQGSPSTRFISDPIGQINTVVGQAGGLNPKNEQILANLLTQFGNLQG